MSAIGVGVPGWPSPTTSWDWWSFAGIAVVILLARRPLGIRLGVVLAVVAVAIGPLYAAVVHRWGVLPTLAATVVVRFALTPFARSRPAPSSGEPDGPGCPV